MADVRRQLKRHLDGLAAAGVEYVPPVAPVPFVIDGLSVAAGASLFDEAAELEQSADDRRQALDVLAGEVAKCEKCPELYSTRTQTVFGVGPLSPDLCFVGEAPGADEDRRGEPFVGAAGQLLNKIIVAMGLSRDEVYICNTLKCRPPMNATPTPQQCKNCRPYFDRQLELIKPKFLCCLGATAAKNVLGTTQGINKLRGRVHDYKGTPVVCTLHPAYLLRYPEAKKDCWDDMKMLLGKMGRPVPGRG
jgi:uracil-DNA glycosylase